MKEMINVTAVKERILKFVADRDWKSFNSPKNIVMSLAVESAELMEIFQWLSEQQSWEIKNDAAKFTHVQEEIADVVINAVLLCAELDIDLPAAIERKLKMNEDKYPVK